MAWPTMLPRSFRCNDRGRIIVLRKFSRITLNIDQTRQGSTQYPKHQWLHRPLKSFGNFPSFSLVHSRRISSSSSSTAKPNEPIDKDDDDGYYEYGNERIRKSDIFCNERKGAWVLLSALEKAKEAQLVEVMSLIGCLETLLPRKSSKDYLYNESAQSSKNESRPIFTLQDTKGLDAENIQDLLNTTRSGQLIGVHTIRALILGATVHFRSKHPNRLVRLSPLKTKERVQIIGDLHGSLSDLATALALMPSGEPTAHSRLLFNGDLADRGDHGIEVICIVCALCLAYPDFVFVNRGNHEDLMLSTAYGLATEISSKYGAATLDFLRPILDAFFRALPLATIIDGDALIVHAGPPPPPSDGNYHSSLAEILNQSNPILTGTGLSRTVVDTHQDSTVGDAHGKASREIIESMLWSDPMIDNFEERLKDKGGKPRGWIPNTSRGAGWKYDATIVRDLLNREGLSRMIRSHEPVQDGCARYEIDNFGRNEVFEFFTVFSASRYPYKEGFNQGAILELKANGKHSVLRYSTEDDEPIENAAGGKQETPLPSLDITHGGEFRDNPGLCAIDPEDIRRSLLEAIAYHRLSIYNELQQQCTEDDRIPYATLVDILVESLRLGSEVQSLKQIGPQVALAKALGIKVCPNTSLPPVDVSIHDLSDTLLTVNTECKNPSKESIFHESYYPWLFSIFEMLDTNQDGFLDRSEWDLGVATINERLVEGAVLPADDTWDLLDADGDGKVSMMEWEKLGRVAMKFSSMPEK